MRPLLLACATIACFPIVSCENECCPATEEKVAPPNDAGKLYLTVFGVPGETQFEQIRGFVRSPKLAGFAAENHYKEIDATSTAYKQRYATTIRGLPCVRLQKANGYVLYQTTGANVPSTADALAASLFRCRPRNEPAPEPAPEFETPDIDVSVAPLDTLPPADEPEPDGPPIVLMILAGVVTFVVLLIRKVRSEM